MFTKKSFQNTVKPEYNEQPLDPKIAAVVDKWSLSRGSFVLKMSKTRRQKSGRCFSTGNRYSEVVVGSGLTVL
jgi:hypothetical protein